MPDSTVFVRVQSHVRDVWADTVFHFLVWFKTLPDKQWLWAHLTSSAMHLTCSTCSTCSPPCKTGHVCFLAGAVVWNTQPSAESSVQRQAHILSKCLIHRIGWWENLQETPIFDGKNHGFRWRFSQQNQSKWLISSWQWQLQFQGYPGMKIPLLTSADRKDYLTCGICGEPLAASSAVTLAATSIHLWCHDLASGYVKIAIENGHLYWVFPLKIGWFSIAMLVYQRVSMLIMIWFREICQCSQRARFDDIWLLELIFWQNRRTSNQ